MNDLLARRMLRVMRKMNRKGTPIRFARGVIVGTSTIGTSQVKLDGGSTAITAFNQGHTQLLPANTVVDVLLNGTQPIVTGAYTDPATSGPVIGQVIASGGTSVSATLVSGQSYLVSAWARGTITASGNSAALVLSGGTINVYVAYIPDTPSILGNIAGGVSAPDSGSGSVSYSIAAGGNCSLGSGQIVVVRTG